MKTSKTVAKLLFVVGALVYLLGLWISCPLLSGKGYFLGVNHYRSLVYRCFKRTYQCL